MKRTLILVGLAAIATAANAQNRNAFKPMDSILGVTVTRAVTQQGIAYTVSVAQNATIIRSGKSHQLEAVEGFWLLADQGDIGAVQTAIQNYDAHSNNSGGSSAYGWQTQLKNAMRPGDTKTFTFSTISDSNAVDHYGYKVKASGVPAHIYQDAAAVPEPATLAVLGLGVAALRRRRRK